MNESNTEITYDYTGMILTWGDGVGRAGDGNILVDILDKPILPFDFLALYFEPATGLLLRITDDKAHMPLTDDEQDACAALALKLVEEADYPVQSFDSDGVYRGTILRSEAVEQELEYCLDPPNHPASKRIGDKWEHIYAVIMDDGSLRIMPDSVCQLCLLTFTESEWEAHTKPATAFEKWDFSTETWKDKRVLVEVKKEAKTLIRRVIEGVRVEWLNNIPSLEERTWQKQEPEARAWLVDNGAATPFIDTSLVGRTISKLDFCNDVISNAKKAWDLLAHAHNIQWTWFDKVDECLTLADVDALVFSFGDVVFEQPQV